ncbi:dTDP-4-dehydrorhamnose reductase [Rhodovulum sp.]|uniref:dTDP-4-dehydrorhamnose reductase n=1 Tax=Rhodovulum sp. TaxID=34009 RepID=UPI00182D6A48|nr:dTDP-4-dehydrorhamnose reductase [Rhodovulum sp.]HDR29637.1 dTDP-4-dehydrorhamnose reductase [Rhodovulum sp.]
MILVFGRTGQVARELAHLAPGAVFLGREGADLADPDACAAAIAAHAPRAVINAAAWTAVDRAETEEALATLINGTAPGAMARECAARAIPFVHISTDYVFDGSGTRPWRPDDPTGPISAYGRSKLAGERAVRAAGGAHAILRTSWVFSAHGANFVKTMLRLGAERDALRIVADQVGGPTPAADIAAACLGLLRGLEKDPDTAGTYHFAGAPDVSWAGFACEIFAQAGLRVAVEEIAAAQYPTPARRPLNSRLDCAALEIRFGITRPDWRKGLVQVLAQLAAERS